ALLMAYKWPGNIDEMKNIVERLLILDQAANDEPISVHELPIEIRSDQNTDVSKISHDYLNLPLREAREHFEREYLLAQVHKFSGNISRTAQFIGMERSALHRKLRTLEVHSPKKQAS